ncbi:MAG: B12-binding domain-containing radical SAM protein [Candidatus Asgardarchaeia archaeon]
MQVAIVDALASVDGKRRVTVDVIGSGPRAISGVLEKWNIKSKIILAEKVLEKPTILKDFDLLMVSGMSVDLPALKKVEKLWKKYSNGPTVIGGPITSRPSDALKKAGYDIAVIGEGEETLEELLAKGLKDGIIPEVDTLSTIKGIAFLRNEEKIIVNQLRPIMPREKYDTYIPSTDRIRDYPLYFAARVYVEILRGCSNFRRPTIRLPDGRKCDLCNVCRVGSLEARYHCHLGIPPGCGYCSVPSLFGPPRSRSINKIVEEVKKLLDKGVRRIVLSAPGFLDYGRDLLVGNKPLTDPREPPPNYEMIEQLLKRLTQIPKIKSGEGKIILENMKANLVDEKVAKIISTYLPGVTVHIGCETGSELHAELLGRPTTPSEVYAAIKILRKYGLNAAVYFIHGLPGQNMKIARETVKFMWKLSKLGISKITIYRFQPLPMSAFENYPKAPPAFKNPASKMIVDAAEQINRKLKEQLIGKIFEIIIASTYRKKFYVGYPMDYGPVVLVPRDHNIKINQVVKVKITKVISDKLIYGIPIHKKKYCEDKNDKNKEDYFK